METINIISKLNYLKEKEKEVTEEVKELLNRFNYALEHKEKERLRLEDEISKLTENRKDTKENLRIVNRNILVYEINLNRVRNKINELDKKGISIKGHYEALLTGPVSNIFTFKEEPGVKGAEGSEANSTVSQSQSPLNDSGGNAEKTELFKKKRDLMTAMNNIFSRYESEIGEIEDKKKRLKEIEDNILKKDEESKREQVILTDSLDAYSAEIERCREKLKSSINEEMRIIEEFTRIIKNIDGGVIVSKEVSDILNRI